jgi:type IV secretion system protein VirB1
MDLPIDQCGNGVDRPVVEAIIQAESGGNPYAIGINVRDGQPYPVLLPAKTREEAAEQARDLSAQGYSIDVGLMQVNSRNLARFGVDWAQAFDVCGNIEAGTRVFQAFAAQVAQQPQVYQTADQQLQAVLSAYNTGSFTNGLTNGYVARVLKFMGQPFEPGALVAATTAASMDVAVSFESDLSEDFWGSAVSGLDTNERDIVFRD